jgi:Tol biopolymer transport system component
VAFIRRVGTGPTSTGVYVHDIGASESRSVASGFGVRDLAWAAAGRSILFVSGSARQGTLWIVDGGGGRPRRLQEKVGTISVARASRTLSFEQRVVDNNVWRASGPASPGKEPPRALSRSPRSDMQPDYSPDGRHIALASAGASGLGVWMCGAEGADCVEFKSEDNLATPQWSPDGRSLAAVGWQGERPLDVYRLEVAGRFVRRLTTDDAVDTLPTWSRDGRWLYFVSDRSGAFELWKMPSTGGEARQLTRQGAGRGYETSDGRFVIFMNRLGFGSLWRMPVEGGHATLVLDRPIHQAKWTLWRDRVVYVDEPAAGPHRVVMFDPTTRRGTTLVSLDRPSASGISVSPDGAWVLYAQTDRVTSDILELQGLR